MIEQVAADAMEYNKWLMPILLVIGGISVADITLNFLFNLLKKARNGGVKW